MSTSKRKKTSLDNAELLGLIQEQKLEIRQLKDTYAAEIHTLHFILQHLPASVYWKNRTGVYLGNNEHAKKLMRSLGFMFNITGKTDYDIFSKEVADSFKKADLAVLSGKNLLTEEITILPDGTKMTQLSSKVPLLDKEDKIIGIVGVSVDITKIKSTEKALELAKGKAEAANQAKNEFLENMRHDIRTPLAGIVGCAQLIQAQANDALKVTEFATDLLESSNALLELLNKVLESIKIATGEIPLSKKTFNLHTTLQHIIDLNKPYAITKKLRLSLEHDAAIPDYIIGDQIRVQRIVLELVTNALKFTETGEVKVSTFLIKNNACKNKIIVQLNIRDTGIGILLDKQKDIYTRFTRLTPSYQSIYSGTGLGLSVVKQFMDDLGATLSLKSQPQQGSTFTCVISFKKPLVGKSISVSKIRSVKTRVEKEVLVTHPSIQSITHELPHSFKSRILVIEDQTIAAKIACHVLAKLNCQTDVAKNGEKAMKLIEKHDYDLILVDVGLPDNDGVEVTRRIRLKQGRDNKAAVPIIGLTAHIDAENKKRCLAAGMEEVLSKPLTVEKASNILAILGSAHRQSTPQ